MKVLFAVGSAVLSEKIASTYFQAYGEKLEYKDVFYFKAILEEVKRDKTYDRIVIAEQLEPAQNNIIDEIDKMLFNNIDSITDELDDSTIIFICSDNRNRSDPLLARFFNLGIYNALVGDERQIDYLCKLLKEPRSKKEAKEYLKSNPAGEEISVQQDEGVNENELLNICRYFEALRGPSEYVNAFASVAEQYNDKDLIVIVAALTKQLKRGKEIFDALNGDPRYQKYCEWNKSIPAPEATSGKKGEKKGLFGFGKKKNNNPEPIPDTTRTNFDINPINDYKASVGETVGAAVGGVMGGSTGIVGTDQSGIMGGYGNANGFNSQQAELERQQEEKRIREEKFRLQQEQYERAQQEAQRQAQLKAQQEAQIRAQQEAQLRAQQEAQLRAQQEAQIRAQQEAQARAQQEAQIRAQQEAQIRAQQEAQARAQQEAQLKAQQEAQLKAQQEAQARAQQEAQLKAQKEAELRAQQEAQLKAQKEAELRAQKEAQLKAQQEEIRRQQQEAQLKAQQEEFARQQEAIKQQQDEFTRQQELLRQQQVTGTYTGGNNYATPNANINSAPIDPMSTINYGGADLNTPPYGGGFNTTNEPEEEQEYDYSSIGPVMEVPADYKKVVAFIGTNKVGTTFVANCVATLMALKGVKTSLLDMTKNRGLFWYYENDTRKYRDEVSVCMSNLSTGIANPIPVGRVKNLSLYTTVPKGREDNRKGYKHRTIVETAKRNCNLLIIDCDFSTPYEYLEQAQDIYVVQDLDLVKVVETKEFFRELKNRHTDWSKLRMVFNSVVPSKITSKRLINDALSYYTDTSETYTEEFEKIKRYTEIPLNTINYAHYVETIGTGRMEYDKFTDDFKIAMEELSKMVYGIPGKKKGLAGVKGGIGGLGNIGSLFGK